MDNQPAAHVVKLPQPVFRDRRQRGRPSPRTDHQLGRRRRPGHLRAPNHPRPSWKTPRWPPPAIAERLANEMPGGPSRRHRVAAGQVIVAGNVGAKQRFEYTVGRAWSTRRGPILCELAESHLRAIASILGHTARRQRNRTLPLVFGRNRQTPRGYLSHQPTQLARRIGGHWKHPPLPQSMLSGNQDRQIRLTHHNQDAGAAPVPVLRR